MILLDVLKYVANHPLNVDNKLGAIIRFAKWQIGSRLLPGAIVYDWINGSKFLVRNGEAGLTGNIYTGLHEYEEMTFLLHALRAEDLFIDVGANVGSYTILACAAIGARGYAFEPIPGTYKRLSDNVRINHLEERVRYFNLGIGNEQEEILFTRDGDTTNHALAAGEKSDTTISVEVSTLDVILKDESPALMKIDVEGYETPVLEGADETLKKESLHSVVIELNGSGSRYGFDESKILEMMFDHGFQSYSYDPLNRTLVNLQGKSQSSANTLFIRDETFVLERIKSAPKISIHGKEL